MALRDEEHPLREICSQWIRKIQAGRKYKKKKFQDTADECMNFFDGAHDFLYGKGGTKSGDGLYQESGKRAKMAFRMTVNKVSELVQLFGPYMYHRNPNRLVTPRRMDVPQLAYALAGNPQFADSLRMQREQVHLYQQAIADLQQHILNFTPNELGLARESRLALNEGLIKGRGVAWTEIYYPPESDMPLIGTFHESVDGLVTDPDVKVAGEWRWIAREVTAPYWEVEDEFGHPRGSLRKYATTQSTEYGAKLGSQPADEQKMARQVGETCDLITYWKIYSKMGMGHYLRGAPAHFRETLDQFGQYVYLVVAEGCPFPLNLGPRVMDLDMQIPGNLDLLLNQIRWPIPFWADNEWPMSVLDFHEVPGCSWPQAHMKPALGELKAIDWVMSFLVSKVKVSSRDILAFYEMVSDEDVLTISEGDDFDMIRLKKSLDQKIQDVVQFIQFPSMNTDILQVLNLLIAMFERRTGLNELLYGVTDSQMRSASEANLRGDMIQIRINDMAQAVEEWATKIARKEGIASRLFLTGRDVAPIFGEMYNPEMGQVGILSQLWDQVVHVPLNPQDTQGLVRVCREFDYRIEAGSVRKPNQQTQMENMNNAAQMLFMPMMQFYQATGNPQQLNQFMRDWSKAHQFDAEPYLFPELPPPGTPPPSANETAA